MKQRPGQGLAIIASLLVIASPALAQDAIPSAPQVKKAKPKLVCRSTERTGTRVSRPQCHSQADWDAFDEASAAEARRFHDTVNARSGINGAGDLYSTAKPMPGMQGGIGGP